MALKIYTKTGDDGTTGLIGGERVPKCDVRIDAYGTVDELNSQLGVVNDMAKHEAIAQQIRAIQDRLFTLGSHLATSQEKDLKMKLPDLHEADIVQLEQWIDDMNVVLPDMKSFIIPGGCLPASQTHVARCICRRAERLCVGMRFQNEAVPEIITTYLNRLSDYLFVLARYITHLNGADDLPWRPRK